MREKLYVIGLIGGLIDLAAATTFIFLFSMEQYSELLIGIPLVYLACLGGARLGEAELLFHKKKKIKVARAPRFSLGEPSHVCPVHGVEYCTGENDGTHCCTSIDGSSIWSTKTVAAN